MLGRVTQVRTVLVRENGRALSVDWAFNAWGGNYDGLYQDYESDDQVANDLVKPSVCQSTMPTPLS